MNAGTPGLKGQNRRKERIAGKKDPHLIDCTADLVTAQSIGRPFGQLGHLNILQAQETVNPFPNFMKQPKHQHITPKN